MAPDGRSPSGAWQLRSAASEADEELLLGRPMSPPPEPPAPGTKDQLLAELRCISQRAVQQQLEQQERLIARFLEQYPLLAPPGDRQADMVYVMGNGRSDESEASEAADMEAGERKKKSNDKSLDKTSSLNSGPDLPNMVPRSPRRSLRTQSQSSLNTSENGLIKSHAGHQFAMPGRESPNSKGKGGETTPGRMGSLRNLPHMDFTKTKTEPVRTGLLATIVQSHRFGTICSLMILFNTVFTIVAANHQLTYLTEPNLVHQVIEYSFFSWYVIELSLKLVVHRLYFFVNKEWGHNTFDFVIIFVDAVGMLLSLGENAGLIDISFLRSMRIFKVTRMLRVLRAFEIFNDLRMLLEAITGSFVSLVWCGIVILFTLCIFALLFVQIVTDYIIHNDDVHQCVGDDCHRDELLKHFGSVQQAMLTLYMASTGGEDWARFYEILNPINTGTGIAFVIFTFCYEFGMFNLLTSMFVDRTMKITLKEDRDSKITEQRKRESKQTKELLELCSEADADGDGTISLEEFAEIMKNDEMPTYLAYLGLDIADVEFFFRILLQETTGSFDVTDDSTVPIETFVQGCMRMKGQATSIDMQALKFQTQLLMRNMARMDRTILGLAIDRGLPIEKMRSTTTELGIGRSNSLSKRLSVSTHLSSEGED